MCDSVYKIICYNFFIIKFFVNWNYDIITIFHSISALQLFQYCNQESITDDKHLAQGGKNSKPSTSAAACVGATMSATDASIASNIPEGAFPAIIDITT